jgi:signal transduction histidine kinase
MPARRPIFLMIAFAALLAVSTLAAFTVWRNAREALDRAAALYERDVRTHEALEAIRGSVYLTAVITRDYLLDTNPASTHGYVDQFNQTQASAKKTLAILEQSPASDLQESALKTLRTELEAYWGPTRMMLRWTPQEKKQQRGTEILRERTQRRREILSLAERIEQLTSQNSAEERERMEAADREFRSSIGWIAAAMLLAGFAICGFTLVRMFKLERQSQSDEHELRMLSGQLRTAQEQERKFLSRELHDQVGQVLTGLRMELAAVSRLHDNPQSEVTERIARAKGTVEQVLGIVRNIAMLLRPSMLDDLGLTPALTWLVKEVSRSSGIEIRTNIDPQVDTLPEAHRTCLFRVLQEALTNASRHSGARAVDLQVSTATDWVHATVADDGKGFASGSEKRKGLGLLGMEERVRELGGSIRVNSSLGRGTVVEIQLPRPAILEAADGEDSDRGRSWHRPDRVTTSL